MNIIIRNETEQDYRKVEEITREAFWNLYIPGCDEHFLAHQIRKHKDFIPELDFVLELDGEIIGSIFYTHVKVITNEGQEFKAISFGPVCILPKYHRQGFGRKLINHSINKAKRLGYKAIFIAGYPYHYATYGFLGTKKYGISMPDGKFYKGIMALPLYAGALDNIKGNIHFSEVCEQDKNEILEFDKQFPYKEKLETQSQIEFAKIVVQEDL